MRFHQAIRESESHSTKTAKDLQVKVESSQSVNEAMELEVFE
jgi:hypothetical protein